MAKADDKDMATDLLIQEVDEDLRREQYIGLWKRYGGYVIVAAVVLVLGVAGYQLYRNWRDSRANQDSAAYGAAVALLAQGKNADAVTALGKLAADGHTGFTVIAALQRAAILSQTGNIPDAEAAYDQIAAGSAPKTLRELAMIKRALLALGNNEDMGPIKPRLAALAVAGDPWYYEALEIEALAARKGGDNAHATDIFKQLADDPKAPSGVRGRAAEMLQATAAPVVPAASPITPPAPAVPVPAPASPSGASH